MVIGRDFAWGHIPKTGGDTTLALFGLVPGIVESADERTSHHKHDPFADRADEIRDKVLAANIRRLPAWLLSRHLHASRHGVYPDRIPIPLPDAETIARSTLADVEIKRLTGQGAYPVVAWLRTEHLAEDFLGFIRRFTDIDADTEEAIASHRHLNVGPYHHDLESWFTASHMETMYECNPLWARIERSVFDDPS